jgi:hypothetical protein
MNKQACWSQREVVANIYMDLQKGKREIRVVEKGKRD